MTVEKSKELHVGHSDVLEEAELVQPNVATLNFSSVEDAKSGYGLQTQPEIL